MNHFFRASTFERDDQLRLHAEPKLAVAGGSAQLASPVEQELLTEPLVTPGEVALRALPVPEGECEICYENGIRKVVAKEG